MQSPFLDRYARVFGRSATLVLKMAGLTASEAHGQGAFVVDANGRRWTDFGSFGVHLLGHCHPAVVETVRRQVGELGLSTKILTNEAILTAGEKLAALTGGRHKGVMFANSGSEAIEVIIKMCRIATGRKRFVALERAYHGRTDGALQLSGSYSRHAAAPTPGNVDFVAAGDVERLADLLAAGTTAAVFVEPVQGEGGIHPVSMEFLSAVRDLCDRHGTLMVCDEIQTGLGRAGHLNHFDQADIIAYGKTLAGGVVPVSAVVFSTEKVSTHARDPVVSASSVAGGPLAGAVAGTVLDIVTADGFLEDVRSKGEHAGSALFREIGPAEGVVAIRGRGLMIGIEFESAALVGEVVLQAMQRDLLVSFCLSEPKVLRLYPPAVTSVEDISDAVTRLAEAVVAAKHEIGIAEPEKAAAQQLA